MIAHLSIAVGNVDTSKRFYNAALEPLGYKYLGSPEITIGLRARKYKKHDCQDPRRRDPVVIDPMSDDNDWKIWNAPPCKDPLAIFLVIAAVVWAILRIWPVSVPALAFVSFFIWQFIKAG